MEVVFVLEELQEADEMYSRAAVSIRNIGWNQLIPVR